MRRRGVVMVMAILILSIVAAALALLTAAASSDGHRTYDFLRQSQLDQMLLAGTTDAATHLQAGSPATGETWDVTLPENLSQRDAKLSTTVTSMNGPVVLQITAQVDGASMRQTVQFKHDDQGWKIFSAEWN